MTILNNFCADFEELLAGVEDFPSFVDRGRELLAGLVSNPAFVGDVLGRLLTDKDYLKEQLMATDPNDVTLYRSPRGTFSLRLFIWSPDVHYPVHDHGSWGIVGCCLNNIRETKYERLDDGATEGYARLAVKNEGLLSPGATTTVLPINDGIHHMQALDGKLALTVHAYGRPVRKGYIQEYLPAENKVRKIFPPKLVKQILAARALDALHRSTPEPGCAEILNNLPDLIKSEIK